MSKLWPSPWHPSVPFFWNSTLVVACLACILLHLSLPLGQAGLSGSEVPDQALVLAFPGPSFPP